MTPWSKAGRRALVGIVVGGILLVVATTAGPGSAAADDPAADSPSASPTATDSKGGLPETSVDNPEELAKQEKLDSYVDPLLKSGLLEAADNFGGSAVDYKANAYDMWWRGDVPSNVQAVLDDFGDVKVRLHDANYTAREIETASIRVAQFSSDQFDVGTVTVENLDRPTTVYGIEVEVTKRGEVSDTAIAAELTEAAGLPVSVNQGLKSFPTSRADDAWARFN